jgi:hypothetical protein
MGGLPRAKVSSLVLLMAGVLACASSGPFERGKRHYERSEDLAALKELDAFTLRDCWRAPEWNDPRCRAARIMTAKTFIRMGRPGLAVSPLDTALKRDPTDREAGDLLKIARAGRDAAAGGDPTSWVVIDHVEKISALKLVEAQFFVDGRKTDRVAVSAGEHIIEALFSYRGATDHAVWKGSEISLKGSHSLTVPKDDWCYVDVVTRNDSSTGFWRFTMDFVIADAPITHDAAPADAAPVDAAPPEK